MNPKSRQDVLLGTVVIAVAALALGTFLFLYPGFGDASNPYTIYFRSSDGLAPIKAGSPVMLSGALQVGKVTQVLTEELAQDTPVGRARQLIVVVKVEISRALNLYDDCILGTDQPPVGGGGYVVIRSVGTPTRPRAGDAPIIGQPPQSFANAIATLSDRLLGPDGIVDKVDQLLDPRADMSLVAKLLTSLSDVNAMTGELRSQLSPADRASLLGKLHRVMDDVGAMTAALKQQTSTEDQATLLARLHRALDELAGAMEQAHGILRDNRPAIQNTLASASSMAQTLNEDVLGKLRGEFNRDDPHSLLAKLHVSMNHVEATLANASAMSESGRVMLATNRPAVQKIVENIQEASNAMRIGMQELIVAPWKLLDKPVLESERKRLEVFEAARRFAEAASTLDAAAVRLEALAAVAPKDGPVTAATEEVEAVRAALRLALERFGKAEEFLFEHIR